LELVEKILNLFIVSGGVWGRVVKGRAKDSKVESIRFLHSTLKLKSAEKKGFIGVWGQGFWLLGECGGQGNSLVVVEEGNGVADPVDGGVVLGEPGLAEDDIMAVEISDSQGLVVGVVGDTHLSRRYVSRTGLDTSIWQLYFLSVVQLHGMLEVVPSKEIAGDEVPGRSAINQEDTRMTFK
jgi:hypothetical protein